MTSADPQSQARSGGDPLADRILLPLSGNEKDERSVPVARALAQREGLPITLMSAVSDDVLVSKQERYLGRVAEQLTDVVTSIHVSVSGSHPLEAIAAECDAGTLPVMATSGRLLPHDTYLGSAAAWMVRETEAPVVLVGARCEPDRAFAVDRVIVPIDGSRLADRTVPLGVHWARRFDVALSIVTVLPESEEPEDATDGESVEIEHLRSLLAETARANGDLSLGSRVLYDNDPARAVAALAGPDRLVCLGSHGRTGLASLAMGSVARKIIRHARQPVVVQCPPELGALSP